MSIFSFLSGRHAPAPSDAAPSQPLGMTVVRPTRSLLEGGKYVRSEHTDLRAVFRRIETKITADEWAKKDGMPL